MRIRLEQSGGFAIFPGLNVPKIVDTEALEKHKAAHLEKLLQEADFFKLPESVGRTRPGSADYFTYTITVENDHDGKTVRTSEPIEDEHLEALIAFIEDESQAQN